MRLLLLLFPLLSGCTGVLFQPIERHLLDPAKFGVTARDVYFETSDHLRLHGWFLPAKTPKAAGTVLFLHGNAENVSTHIASVYWLPDYGFNVFLFDYRGFGRSQGKPTLPGLHKDFAAALDTVLAMKEVEPAPIVVFGQSMGGATAITALAESPHRDRVRALVVEAAPTSYRALARELLGNWWLTWALQWPLSLTIDDDYRPVDRIGRISPIPVLIVHSRDDNVVPFHHGEQLYRAAQQPKTFWPVESARHIAAFADGALRERLVEWLRRVLAEGEKL